ncbi:MAG: hypothetical protein A3J62_01975 [Candidatus Buchananbacteria bacterium RIFCSPHIGHO2_02_FULL_38_8]|uniref:tetrahydrofolate synthase n=2 Tax=Candidatus Buchananiibacteriota TaxID=1817903 RepID=A0A1G1XYE9_9BACT|nr:MAG: hypothetical protein A2731_00285 [Candidatus Buchananbacteria bacterium RIFCSPHIGHO2_01_FULL_39_8]OGY46809.1 MAG: hypothetical protein A3J62_01975 [Candidatus Buchananbacteria bacterium RIFCSPHIGHO2_02_FULL_38_8]
MKNNFEKYYQAVKYLESLPNISQPDYMAVPTRRDGRSLFLKRFKYFLNLLGNPQKDLKYIHVGGSSGKGSVAMMIHSILTEAGYKSGVYTSPYSTTPIEKIKVGNLLIGPDEFVGILEKIKPAIDKSYQQSPYGRPSWFEIYTAIAIIYFKQKKCDYAVLEVGLGGRYDATNIIPAPVITIINVIDYDHVDLLGKTLTKIALEKAAIIKPKTKFFTTDTNSKKVLKIFKQACKAKKAEFNLVKSPTKKYQLSLLGEHQQKNAEIAKAACRRLGIPENKIRLGLQKAKMPCRIEIIQKNPLVILDGAHNPSKMKTLVETLKNLNLSNHQRVKKLTYKKLYLIIALTNERSATQIFKEIQLLADYLFITRYESTLRKCYPPLQLTKKLKSKKPTEIFLDPYMALQKAMKLAKKNDLILVTGSFYLAGELRKYWRSEEKILLERKI